MTNFTFDKTWSVLLEKQVGGFEYWIDKKKIPIGSLEPPYTYEGRIPDKDIVTIPFDPIGVPLTKRKAMNILMLGASGDGKSLIFKQIWSILHNAGFYCIYVDPKSTDSGRASRPWNSSHMAPYLKPEGIPLQHFMPVWSTTNYQHMAHNFRLYSTPLEEINGIYMWQGLGMTRPAAIKVTEIIQRYKKDISFELLREKLSCLPSDELAQATLDNILRTLTALEYFEVVSANRDKVDMIEEWKRKLVKDSKTGCSICLSYNRAPRIFMTFDIGLKINQSSKYYDKYNNHIPIMWFLDDSSLYADKFEDVKFNFAVYEIQNIGYAYRSLGIYNCLAVQSLSIIDQGVAEAYPIKIISPLFNGVEKLAEIGIPKKAIQYLKSGRLVIDKERHLIQLLFIDESKNVVPFFPFTPPCSHFTEIYFPKQAQKGVEA